MFSCEFCEIFQNTFSYRTPLVTATDKTDKTVNSHYVSLRIQSECGKIRTRKNSVLGHFPSLPFRLYQRVLLTLPVPYIGESCIKIKDFIFTLLRGTSKGFKKAFTPISTAPFNSAGWLREWVWGVWEVTTFLKKYPSNLLNIWLVP